jgi:HK97 family phage portal protein
VSSELARVANGLQRWVFGSITPAGGGRVASTPEQVQDMLLLEAVGGASGSRVSDADAMRVAAVWACIRLLSTAVAMLPVSLYRREGDKHTVEIDHPVHELVSLRPNFWQTSFEFWQMAVAHILMRGNFYAEKVIFKGEISDLLPLDPTYMDPKITPEGRLVYEYRGPNGRQIVYPREKILHMRGLTLDGLKGLSVLSAARNSISFAARSEEHGSSMMTNGARPSGVLQTDDPLTEEAFQRIRADFEKNFCGSGNTGRPMILESGLKWAQMALSAEDAQFIDQRKFTRSELAMFFGVPPHMIGDIERGTSWGSGIETQNLGFLVHTLLPYLINIQQACVRDLIPFAEQSNFVVKFDTSLLTRADFGSRQTGLQIQKRNGVISANDWRKIEGLDPIEDTEADAYRADQGAVAPAAPGQSEQETA